MNHRGRLNDCRRCWTICSLSRFLIAIIIGCLLLPVFLHIANFPTTVLFTRESNEGSHFYHESYFEMEDPSQVKTLQNINLDGRHSDYVLPPCKDPNGNHPNNTNPVYDFEGPFDYLSNYKNPCWYEGTDTGQSLRCIPYFYIIGTVKCATTDLFTRILKHPHIVRVHPLEKRWFDRVRFSEPAKAALKSYIQWFQGQVPAINAAVNEEGYHYKVFGDDAPSTTFTNLYWTLYPGNEWCVEPRVVCLSHIHHLNPSAKLILIMRNPVDRLYSDYLFNTKVTHGNATPEEFHQRIVGSLQPYEECFKTKPYRRCLYGPETTLQTQLFSFVSGIYSRLILDVLKIFPRNQLHVIRSEDYKKDIRGHMSDIFRFLELDSLPTEVLDRVAARSLSNKGKRYGKAGSMLPHTRKLLEDFHRPYNEELAQILNDDRYLLWNQNR